MISSHVVSRDLGDLAAIYDPHVELVSISRPPSQRLNSQVHQLFARRADFRAQWIQKSDDADTAARHLPACTASFRSGRGAGEVEDSADVAGSALTEEIDSAVAALSCLLGCHEVGVRLATLRAPMCPKFHVDRIPCRLLITLDGPGTDWIPHDRVDWNVLNNHATPAEPLKSGCHYESLEPNAWSLLKGGDWDDSFKGVVHRSPHRRGNRLLLTLDPLFEGPR